MNLDDTSDPPPPSRRHSRVQPLSIEELEKLLFEDQDATPDEKIQWMWRLAQSLKSVGMAEMAEQKFRLLLDLVDNLEAKAQIVLALGQMAEQARDYHLAVSFYRQALSMEPADSWTWYYIQNNLGYSLNQLARYEEGETYCRRAIASDPKFPNAHKNLGLALLGQLRLREAAACFIEATHADALDPRATDHFSDLLDQCPTLRDEFATALESCKNEVKEATLNYLKAMHTRNHRPQHETPVG
jgi:tetratricopeptide (TPR) repeat protein